MSSSTISAIVIAIEFALRAVCGTKALTKAGNVVFAAHKTLAHKPQREDGAE